MNAIALMPSAPLPSWIRPLRSDDHLWRFAAAALTTVAALMVGWQLIHFGFARLMGLLPSEPAFYVVLAALYLTLPLSEWIIFHRIWSLPPSGIVPLLRKGVINDLVINYGGELHLYTWARARMPKAIMPFNAIKDVSILSAISAHILTLTLMVIAALVLGDMIPPNMVVPAIGSSIVLSLVPLAATMFARRIFSLGGEDIGFVTAVHFTRLIISLLLGILLCYLAMPEVPIGAWLLLQTGRLLVSRLPLIPNKDLLFASALIVFAGRDSAVAALMSMTAMALLSLHFLVFATLAGMDLFATMSRYRHAD